MNFTLVLSKFLQLVEQKIVYLEQNQNSQETNT